jgi:hypothetical protein
VLLSERVEGFEQWDTDGEKRGKLAEEERDVISGCAGEETRSRTMSPRSRSRSRAWRGVSAAMVPLVSPAARSLALYA